MATETTILVVEDDASLRRSLEMTLKAAGYVAVGVGTLADARRMRAHYKPQAILLDLGLPDGDGLDFIGAVRRDDLTPIVVLTARDAEALKVRALDAGADDYVTKPFGLEELLARLRAAQRHAVQAAGSAPVVRTGRWRLILAPALFGATGARSNCRRKNLSYWHCWRRDLAKWFGTRIC